MTNFSIYQPVSFSDNSTPIIPVLPLPTTPSLPSLPRNSPPPVFVLPQSVQLIV